MDMGLRVHLNHARNSGSWVAETGKQYLLIRCHQNSVQSRVRRNVRFTANRGRHRPKCNVTLCAGTGHRLFDHLVAAAGQECMISTWPD